MQANMKPEQNKNEKYDEEYKRDSHTQNTM